MNHCKRKGKDTIWLYIYVYTYTWYTIWVFLTTQVYIAKGINAVYTDDQVEQDQE